MTKVCDVGWREVKAGGRRVAAWSGERKTYWMGRGRRFAVSYVIENRERDRFEPATQENRRSVGMLVCGCGFVRPVGGSGVVSARDGLLHRELLPHRAASSPEKASFVLRDGLRA